MLETYIGTIGTLSASIGAQRVNIVAHVNVGAPLRASIGMLKGLVLLGLGTMDFELMVVLLYTAWWHTQSVFFC